MAESEDDDAVERLQRRGVRLQEEVALAEQVFRDKQAELNKVKRALRVLSPETPSTSPLKKDDILPFLKAARAESPGASPRELHETLKKQLQANGRSTSGLGLLILHAMKEVHEPG